MIIIPLKKLFELKLEDYSLPTLVKNHRRIQEEACEICGTGKTAERTFQLVKRGAKIVLFGLAYKISSVKIDLEKFFLKEMTMVWSLFNPFTFPTAVALLVMNKVTVEPLEPEPLHFETLISFFSQPIDKSKIKYQFIQNN